MGLCKPVHWAVCPRARLSPHDQQANSGFIFLKTCNTKENMLQKQAWPHSLKDLLRGLLQSQLARPWETQVL